MCLSSVRSAISYLRVWVSSSTWRNRRNATMPIPRNARFHRSDVCSVTPSLRQISTAGVPDSARRRRRRSALP